MVQIIPENRRPSTAQRLSEGVGRGLEMASQMYQEHQRKKKYGEALKGVEDIYSDPNMTQEQKFAKSFSTLRDFPEAAKQFTTGMAHFNETPLQKAQRLKLEQELDQAKGEEDYLTRLMGEGQSQEQEETPFERVAEMEEGPEEITPKRASAKKPKFDYQDPTTWSEKQINQFRSIEGKTAKAKTLSRMAQNEFDRRQESKKASAKYQESVAPLEGALDILGQMEKIGKEGLLGIGTKARGIFSPKARRAAGEYERLGKSLISYSTNIPIRNRQEFEALAHDLYDPSISDDKREGILAGMKRIIQNSIKSYAAPEEGSSQTRKPAQKEKPPLTSFLR